MYNNNMLIGPRAEPLFVRKEIKWPKKVSRFLSFFGNPFMFTLMKEGPNNPSTSCFREIFYNKRLDFIFINFFSFIPFCFRVFTSLISTCDDFVSMNPHNFFFYYSK
jgi:hypothetical protein